MLLRDRRTELNGNAIHAPSRERVVIMLDCPSVSWWDSRLARRIQALVGVAAMVVVCKIALEEDLSWIGWVMAGAAFFSLIAVRWPYGALLALIGSSATPRFFVSIFGWNARPEHFVSGTLALVMGIWLVLRKRSSTLDKLDYWILAYVVINYVSSGFGSSSPATTIRWAFQNNLAVAPYFLVRFLVDDLKVLRGAFQIFMGVGISEVVYGLLCYGSHQMFGTSTGMEVGAYLEKVAAPYGTMFEPNLFGAYSACIAVLFLALYLTYGKYRIISLICFLVATVAAISSFSRAALVALIISIGWVFWRTRHLRQDRPYRSIVFVMSLGLILVIAYSAVGGVMQERIGDLVYQGLTEGTAISRVLVIHDALQEVPNHLLLGSGTASFNLSFDWARYIPEWSSDKTWIGNAPLRILHDVGLIGLTAFVGFLITLCLRIRRNLISSNPGFPILLGLSAGALVYGISFQSTDGTILAFFWVHLGFLASASILTSNANLDLEASAQ